jgi:hypothetical protein
MLDQSGPGCLRHVRGIGVTQPVSTRNSPHSSTKLVQERVPATLVTGRRRLHQLDNVLAGQPPTDSHAGRHDQ